MTKGTVHRGLNLATPAPKGSDVKILQANINKAFRHFKIDRRIAEDGEFGRQTLSAARQVALLKGAVGNNRKYLKKGRVTKSAQKLIRGRKKSRRERLATAARKPYRRKLRKRYSRTGGIKALKWAIEQIGTTESPAGSNWGPKIGEWITFTGYSFPVYWCGCFACYAVVKVGGAKIPTRIRIGYTGYITADANAGVNGLTAVPFSQARAGDIVVYSFDHIGLVERVDGDTLFAIEGNTSSGSSGSQSNGGGVFRRVRSRSDVVTIARPDY
jgi:hypothetical protein